MSPLSTTGAELDVALAAFSPCWSLHAGLRACL